MAHMNAHLRMAVHWGAVKTRPNGDVFGREVHRVYRIESVQMQDQIEPAPSNEVLPADNRILITQQGLEQLSDPDQLKFRPAGTFRLKGFDEFCQLWVLHKEVS
jgi:class 3 adenylate cyclase